MTDLERVARALVRQYEIDDGFSEEQAERAAQSEMWRNFRASAQSALSVLQQSGWGKVPEGWKIVPIEPTNDMVCDGWRSFEDYTSDPHAPEKVYRAMISSSPNPTQEGTIPVVKFQGQE